MHGPKEASRTAFGAGLAALFGGLVAANVAAWAWAFLLFATLYSLCAGGAAPTVVCRNGAMDYVLHPVEPLTSRLILAGAF